MKVCQIRTMVLVSVDYKRSEMDEVHHRKDEKQILSIKDVDFNIIWNAKKYLHIYAYYSKYNQAI